MLTCYRFVLPFSAAKLHSTVKWSFAFYLFVISLPLFCSDVLKFNSLKPSVKRLKLVGKFELNPAQLCGVTTDGAPSMTGRTNGFTKKFLNAVGAEDVVVSQCIFHQENLCTKIVGFAEVMGNVGQCANYIRARGFNHR